MHTVNQTFKKDQQLFLTYGRRSNRYLLLFYGLCIPDNKYDSITVRIHKKVDKESKLGGADKLIKAMVLDEDQVRHEFSTGHKTSKRIQLKPSKLDFITLAYLRAHLYATYSETIDSFRVTEPTNVEFELCVLDGYSMLLDRVTECKQLTRGGEC